MSHPSKGFALAALLALSVAPAAVQGQAACNDSGTDLTIVGRQVVTDAGPGLPEVPGTEDDVAGEIDGHGVVG